MSRRQKALDEHRVEADPALLASLASIAEKAVSPLASGSLIERPAHLIHYGTSVDGLVNLVATAWVASTRQVAAGACPPSRCPAGACAER